MRLENSLLAVVAVAAAVLSFALVRGLRRIASADSRPVAGLDSPALPPAASLQPAGEIELAANERTSTANPPEPGGRPATAAPAVRAEDPVQGIVWGYLLDPDGRPDGEAGITFRDATGEGRHVELDERGAYSIAGLAPGTWWVSVGSILMRKEEQSLEIPPTRTPIRRDFVLRARPRIDVQLVAPDGRPFFEAAKEQGLSFHDLVPVATREPPGERLHEVVGSLNNPFGVGQFWYRGQGGVSLPEGFYGSVLLEVDPPVLLSLVLHHLVLETRRVEAVPAVVTFTLDPAELVTLRPTLRLCVVAAVTGAPISGAEVFLSESQVFRGRKSDDAGEVTLPSLLPGRDELRVAADGFAMHRAPIELEPGVTTDLEVALEPEVRVSGTVSGPDGEPLAADFAIGRVRDDGTLDLDDSWYQMSDATGRFDLLGLAAGRHVLQVSVQHSSPHFLPHADLVSENIVVDTRPGPVEGLTIRLPRPSRVAVRWASGARADLHLSLLDQHGLPRQWGRFYSAAPQTFALPPGRWKLEVTDSEKHVVAEQEFTLTAEPLQLVVCENAR